MKKRKIQKKIIKKIKKISKLQEEIYWLARRRDSIQDNSKHLK
tara:strand:- start:652 stop:780 length:129 start_codon:yes stop_codon:yes gene_type:complete